MGRKCEDAKGHKKEKGTERIDETKDTLERCRRRKDIRDSLDSSLRKGER